MASPSAHQGRVFTDASEFSAMAVHAPALAEKAEASLGRPVGVDRTPTEPLCRRVGALPIHNLDKLFYPRSVAVVSATDQDDDPGHVVMHNLLQGGFQGPIMPVTDREQDIAGVPAYPQVGALPIV